MDLIGSPQWIKTILGRVFEQRRESIHQGIVPYMPSMSKELFTLFLVYFRTDMEAMTSLIPLVHIYCHAEDLAWTKKGWDADDWISESEKLETLRAMYFATWKRIIQFEQINRELLLWALKIRKLDPSLPRPSHLVNPEDPPLWQAFQKAMQKAFRIARRRFGKRLFDDDDEIDMDAFVAHFSEDLRPLSINYLTPSPEIDIELYWAVLARCFVHQTMDASKEFTIAWIRTLQPFQKIMCDFAAVSGFVRSKWGSVFPPSDICDAITLDLLCVGNAPIPSSPPKEMTSWDSESRRSPKREREVIHDSIIDDSIIDDGIIDDDAMTDVPGSDDDDDDSDIDLTPPRAKRAFDVSCV